jgi:hypothetical protein
VTRVSWLYYSVELLMKVPIPTFQSYIGINRNSKVIYNGWLR